MPPGGTPAWGVGWEATFGTRTLASHIKTLRAKVGPHRIRTVHGVGYALEVRP